MSAERTKKFAPLPVFIAAEVSSHKWAVQHAFSDNIHPACMGIDPKNITIRNPRDWATVHRFGADVDGRQNLAGCTRHAPIRDQRDL